MNINELLKHDSLGIDFDGTLIEHPRSHILQRFILDHQKIKQFHIITYRSHGMQDSIADDLYDSTEQTKVPLRLEHFTGIHNIADDLFVNHKQNQLSPNRDKQWVSKDGIILPNASDIYYTWKAAKCIEIGCTVLIDDMEPTIGPHCDRIGILCLNPDHY